MTQFLGFASQGTISTGGHGYKWGWDCTPDVKGLWHYFEASGVQAICGSQLPNMKDYHQLQPPPVESMCPGCRAVLTRRMLEEQGGGQ